MFDWIMYQDNCPMCDKPLNGFQSKDGPCDMKMLQPEEVGKFHNRCEDDGCDTWINYQVISRNPLKVKVIDESKKSMTDWIRFDNMKVEDTTELHQEFWNHAKLANGYSEKI
jgi:hypothetical protein